MKAGITIFLALLISTHVFAQLEDTTTFAYDTTYVDDATDVYDTTYVDADYYNDEDSAYSSSTYTQSPGELSSTKNERNKHYTEKKFSKTAWKKIVGETNYTEDPREEKKEKPRLNHSPSLAWNPAILKIIGYVAILLLIGAVIYFLLKGAMQDEGSVKNSNHTNSFLYDKHIDEVREDDLERLLREALERNDFRVAVRLYYIKLLKHLHSTGFIAWKKDKTNHDYAAELGAFPFTRDFKKLMTAYEIIWYGERTPSAEEFKKLQVNFNDLQHQANRTA